MEAEPASGQSVQRYYDPGIGRFLSVDPVTAYQGGLQHFNRYAYAYGNPYKFTDPDGRCPDACVIEGGVVISAGVIYAGVVALGAIGACAATCDKIQNSIEGVFDKLIQKAQEITADSPESAGDKISEGTKPAKGRSGEKGELEGTGGQSGADGAFDSADGTNERSPREGVRVKDLAGGGTIETHPSSKSPDYLQGTPTVKVQDANGAVIKTVR